MKHNFLVFCTLVLLAGLLVGCAKPASPAATLQFVDGLGREVTLVAPAERIVSLAPSATEILFAIGAGGQVIGRDSFSNYPEAAVEIQDVGGSMGDYSTEMIASLNPDLVLATEINTLEQVKALEDLGLTVYYIKNPTDLAGLFPILTTVGALTGHSTDAEVLVTDLENRVKTVTDALAEVDGQVLVFYELDGSDPAKPWTSGPGTFLDQLVQMAGGTNLGAVMKDAWAQISLEELLVQDPDVIILGDSAYGVTAEAVAARAGWSGLTAVKENKIYAFNDDLVSRPGPRLVDGLETLAKLLHPEMFD